MCDCEKNHEGVVCGGEGCRCHDEVKSIVDMNLKNVSITEAVYLTVGAASACWETLEGAGVFQDERARDVAEQLLHKIHRDYESDEKCNVTQTEQPKEWIERQEEERRAWAINTAIDALRYTPSIESQDFIETAERILTFIDAGESKDLNDVDAQDTFYGVLFEILKDGVPEKEFLEEYMINIVDQLAKNGVRLKDGERSEMP